MDGIEISVSSLKGIVRRRNSVQWMLRSRALYKCLPRILAGTAQSGAVSIRHVVRHKTARFCFSAGIDSQRAYECASLAISHTFTHPVGLVQSTTGDGMDFTSQGLPLLMQFWRQRYLEQVETAGLDRTQISRNEAMVFSGRSALTMACHAVLCIEAQQLAVIRKFACSFWNARRKAVKEHALNFLCCL